MNNKEFIADLANRTRMGSKEVSSLVSLTVSAIIGELTEEFNAIKAEVLEKMIEHNDKSFDTGNLLITVIAPSVRETFDSKKFKAEHEDLYGDYIKKSTTKESLKLTLR